MLKNSENCCELRELHDIYTAHIYKTDSKGGRQGDKKWNTAGENVSGHQYEMEAKPRVDEESGGFRV